MWNADDSKLISCGTDGAVYEWNLSSGKRETECVLKSCSYNCVTVSPDSKIIFAVGSDQTLKEIADSSVSRPGPPSRLLHWSAEGSLCVGCRKSDGKRAHENRVPSPYNVQPVVPIGSAQSLLLLAFPAQHPT